MATIRRTAATARPRSDSREERDGRQPLQSSRKRRTRGAGAAAQRRRGGAARGALRRRSRHPAHLHQAQDQGLRGARRGGPGAHREECRHGAGRDRHRFPRRRRGAAAVEGGRRRRQGRARAFPEGPAALAAEDRAVDLHPACAQSGALGADRRQRHGLRAGLRPALRARPRRQAPLRHDRGFPQFREARLHGAVDPPFGRHGVRAGRRAGEQAPPRHGLCAHQIFRQAVHGLGHRAGARRRHGGDGQDRVRRRVRRRTTPC